MSDCTQCANYEDCIESCIDCVCATCIRHTGKEDCCLSGQSDWFELIKEATDA